MCRSVCRPLQRRVLPAGISLCAWLLLNESLRDSEASLRAAQSKLYHSGFRGKFSRNTLAHVNETRDWRIYADFARVIIQQARVLYIMDRGYMDFSRLYRIH